MQPPAKRRRTETAVVEEIKFDTAARQEYLTGFHRRKLQRAKHAQEAAEKKARLERIEERRKLREERKADLERHIREANAFLRPLQEIETESESESEAGSREAERWDGISEPPNVDQRAQYVDEDRYTTVTVEAMDLSKEGLHRAEDELRKRDEDRQGGSGKVTGKGENMNQKRKWTREKPKERQDRPKRKKKFRYESKGERRAARVKDKMRKSKKASARRAA